MDKKNTIIREITFVNYFVSYRDQCKTENYTSVLRNRFRLLDSFENIRPLITRDIDIYIYMYVHCPNNVLGLDSYPIIMYRGYDTLRRVSKKI